MFEGCSGCCLTIVLVPLLCICLAACGLIYISTSSPDAPVNANFVADQAYATNFSQKIDSLKRTGRNSEFSLEFNEAEISSWIALEELEVVGLGDGTLPFENAQVGLQDGEMTFYGVVTDLGVDIPVELGIKPAVDEYAHLTLDITRASVGGVNMPDVILQHVINEFDDLLVEPLNELPNNYQITELRIEDGQFVLRGWVY